MPLKTPVYTYVSRVQLELAVGHGKQQGVRGQSSGESMSNIYLAKLYMLL